MHPSEIYDEAECLLGEDAPSTQAFLSLTYAQRIAVFMLSRGAKQTEVAVEIKRNVRTLQYWMASPTFRQALHEATRALLKEASASLHSKLGKAIDRLERIAQDPSEPAGARVAANKALITLALRMDNTVERDEQIQFLREESQQVLALSAERPAHTGKNTKEQEIPSEPSSPERSEPLSVASSAEPAGHPSVPYITSVPLAPYATASVDKAHRAAAPPQERLRAEWGGTHSSTGSDNLLEQSKGGSTDLVHAPAHSSIEFPYAEQLTDK